MRLAHLPTPLEALPRLGRQLGVRLSVKREDCTGLAGGGNKARKLDALIEDALAQGCDVVLTSGALQSNHCRMTAAACARAGLACELLVDTAVAGAGEAYRTSGNVLLDELLGAVVHVGPNAARASEPGELAPVPLLGGDDPWIARAMDERVAALREAGHRPYAVPPGGSSPVGASAYVGCARELAGQAPDATLVVTATTTGGTQAGLLAGLPEHVRLVGVSAALDAATTTALVGWLAGEAARLAGVPAPTRAPEVSDAFVGPGYGVPTEAGRHALALAARLEGLVLDPVYSAKAMAWLVDAAASGQVGPDDHVVFVHTGGLPSLFGFPRDALLPA